jgi:hypothetical protein
LVSNEFNIDTWPTKLNKWWHLDFSEFTKSLKLKLSLQQKDELLSLFEKYKQECLGLDIIVKQSEREIDSLVYKLYNLTSDEIKVIENS